MDEFLAESKIQELEFTPYTFGIHPMAQTIIFIFYEVFMQLVFPVPFEKELIRTADGGTIGLDWDEGKPDPKV